MTAIHLLKPHRHGGRDYPAGATLLLPQRKAAWLVALGVGVLPSPAPEGKPFTRRGAIHRTQKETIKETEE